MFAQDSVLGSKQRTPIDINRKQAWKILMRVHEARYKIYSPTVNLRTTLFYLAAWNQTSQQIKIWVKQVLEVNSINLQKEESATMMDTFNSEIGGTDPITLPLPHSICNIPPVCTSWTVRKELVAPMRGRSQVARLFSFPSDCSELTSISTA